MAEAFVYDHVRTPRGKGKADGSLHEVTAIELGSQTLRGTEDPQTTSRPIRSRM